MSKTTKILLLASALGISALVFLFYLYGVFTPLEEKIRDRFFLSSSHQSSLLILAVDDNSIERIGQWPWKRAVFADVLNKLQNAHAVGFDIHFSEPSSQGPLDDERFVRALQKSTVPVVLPVELSRDGLPRVTPLPEFSKYARVGAINITLDSGAVVRTIVQSPIDSFDYLLSGSTKEQTTRRIAYKGPAQTYLQFSVSDLLDGSIPPSVLRGSTVLIGATALSLHDIVLTPFGNMSGVEVHANSIETIANDIRFSESMPAESGVDSEKRISFAIVSILLACTSTPLIFPNGVSTIS